MVRPPKASDLAKSSNNFRRVTKKGIKNPEIEEKYRNKASFTIKPVEKKKINIPIRKISEEDFSSTPPSLRKNEQITPKISVKLSKRSTQSVSNRTLNKNRPSVSASANKDGGKRTTSAGRSTKPRVSPSKNKIPAIAKSEPMKRINEKEGTNKKQKHKGKNTNPSPPPDSYFKAEGKLRTSSQPNKVIGRLITPRLVEERCEKVEQELKNKLVVNKIENSNVSLMTHYCVGLKSSHALEKKGIAKHIRKFRKTRIPSRKLKKASVSKSDLKKKTLENLERKSKKSDIIKQCSSDEKPLVREIKHNDSFVISAKKLQNSAKVTKRPKPEIIRLFKRRDGSKGNRDSNPLKSCLKKNSDGNPKQSFGEEGNGLPGQLKRSFKSSQIPRLSREKAVVN